MSQQIEPGCKCVIVGLPHNDKASIHNGNVCSVLKFVGRPLGFGPTDYWEVYYQNKDWYCRQIHLIRIPDSDPDIEACNNELDKLREESA